MTNAVGRLLLASLLVAGACGRPASSSPPLGGCGSALQERAAAQAEIDTAAGRAVARNQARTAQLQAIAQQGKQDVAKTADLGPCDAGKPAAGVAADVADLRARYRVVVDRTAAQLDQAASQPVIAPQKDNKGKHTGG